MTHISNLSSVLASGGLQSNSALRHGGISYSDIAYQDLQGRRATKRVPCGKRGVLHDYVPFYFNPRSPMLYTIHKGNVSSYSQGQFPIVHLVTTAQAVEASGCSFVFTDGHGIVAFTGFFDDLAQLDSVDWDVMRDTYWRDTNEDQDRSRRRQAEFLVHEFVPFEIITEIGVYNGNVQRQVEAALQATPYQPVVKEERNWYYG
jgi:hypothetical protein